jgi:hypothetical protein
VKVFPLFTSSSQFAAAVLETCPVKFAKPLSVSRHISSRSEPGFWKSDTNAAPPASELRNIGPAFAHTLVFCSESTCTIMVTSLLSASLS